MQSLALSMVLTRLNYFDWSFTSPDEQTLVSAYRGSTVIVFSMEVQSYSIAAPSTPLANLSRAISIPPGVLAFQRQPSLAPSYLSDELHHASDVDSWRWLQSALTADQMVAWSKYSLIGDLKIDLFKRGYASHYFLHNCTVIHCIR